MELASVASGSAMGRAQPRQRPAASDSPRRYGVSGGGSYTPRQSAQSRSATTKATNAPPYPGSPWDYAGGPLEASRHWAASLREDANEACGSCSGRLSAPSTPNGHPSGTVAPWFEDSPRLAFTSDALLAASSTWFCGSRPVPLVGTSCEEREAFCSMLLAKEQERQLSARNMLSASRQCMSWKAVANTHTPRSLQAAGNGCLLQEPAPANGKISASAFLRESGKASKADPMNGDGLISCPQLGGGDADGANAKPSRVALHFSGRGVAASDGDETYSMPKPMAPDAPAPNRRRPSLASSGHRVPFGFEDTARSAGGESATLKPTAGFAQDLDNPTSLCSELSRIQTFCDSSDMWRKGRVAMLIARQRLSTMLTTWTAWTSLRSERWRQLRAASEVGMQAGDAQASSNGAWSAWATCSHDKSHETSGRQDIKSQWARMKHKADEELLRLVFAHWPRGALHSATSKRGASALELHRRDAPRPFAHHGNADPLNMASAAADARPQHAQNDIPRRGGARLSAGLGGVPARPSSPPRLVCSTAGAAKCTRAAGTAPAETGFASSKERTGGGACDSAIDDICESYERDWTIARSPAFGHRTQHFVLSPAPVPELTPQKASNAPANVEEAPQLDAPASSQWSSPSPQCSKSLFTLEPGVSIISTRESVPDSEPSNSVHVRIRDLAREADSPDASPPLRPPKPSRAAGSQCSGVAPPSLTLCPGSCSSPCPSFLDCGSAAASHACRSMEFQASAQQAVAARRALPRDPPGCDPISARERSCEAPSVSNGIGDPAPCRRTSCPPAGRSVSAVARQKMGVCPAAPALEDVPRLCQKPGTMHGSSRHRSHGSVSGLPRSRKTWR